MLSPNQHCSLVATRSRSDAVQGSTDRKQFFPGPVLVRAGPRILIFFRPWFGPWFLFFLVLVQLVRSGARTMSEPLSPGSITVIHEWSYSRTIWKSPDLYQKLQFLPLFYPKSRKKMRFEIQLNLKISQYNQLSYYI